MALIATVSYFMIIYTYGINPGFEYPEKMPNPHIAHTAMLVRATTEEFLSFETPVILLQNDHLNDIFWNCFAVYDEVALDIITKKEPIVRADLGLDVIQQYITEETKPETNALCAYYAVLQVVPILIPEQIGYFQTLFGAFGLDPSLVDIPSALTDCGGISNVPCLQSVAAANNYSPYIMGGIVALGIIDKFDNDGWNTFGNIGKDGGECTANCNPYSDYTGYEPVTDDLNRWQRLQEDNGKGFFYHYDHVVPHIGFTAKTKFLTREELRDRKAPNPNYDYEVETQKVIERLAELATNDTQKMLVEFFDIKPYVDAAVFNLAANYLNWENRVMFYSGTSSAEYDAMITVWREKRIWDLVRPTTLIKAGIAGDTITTYAGPGEGVKTINAADFESYIPVMPHSEYPSGSRCICLSGAQFFQSFFQEKLGIPNGAIPFTIPVYFPPADFESELTRQFVAGSSRIEPGISPTETFNVSIPNFEIYADLCGESRLWGGMHFTASIDGATELCDGIGAEAYEFMNDIRNGNLDAFEDEEIPPFEEEYELELELTIGKKRKKKNKDKKKEDSMLPIYDDIFNVDDDTKNNYDFNKRIFFETIAVSSIVTAAITVMIMYCLCIKGNKKTNKGVIYDKGNFDSSDDECLVCDE